MNFSFAKSQVFYCSKVISICAFLSLVSCSMLDNQMNPSSREPAQVKVLTPTELTKMNPTQLSNELYNRAVLMRQTLPQVGSFKGKLLDHFIDSSRRIQGTPEAPTRVMGLYQTMQKIASDKNISSLLGNESKEAVELQNIMNDIFNGLQNQIQLSSSDTIKLGLASDISYLRFLTNKVVKNLKIYADNLSSGIVRTNFANIHNTFIGIRGKVSALSFSINNANDLLYRVKDINSSLVWSAVQKIYIPLAGSSEIDGMAQDIEVAESIKFGFDSTKLLLTGIQNQLSRKPASFEDTSEMDFSFARYPAEDDEDKVEADAVKLPPMKYSNLILIGNVPGQYIGKDKNTYGLASIEIKNRLVVGIKPLNTNDIPTVVKASVGKQVIVLKNSKPDALTLPAVDTSFDVIYPGLIDLHNHTKQNNLPVWSQAKGQFENRFEWRGWGDYTKSVSQNMNPWIQFGKPIECAAFRWSEIKAMIIGTTYLQGPSNCVESFGIQRVEDGTAFVSEKDSVQAPTDLIYPNEMQFVWSELRPQILQGKTYEQALADSVNKYCPGIQGVTADTVNKPAGLKILKDQALLKKTCPEPLPSKFIRYVYWIHPTIAGRKNYFQGPKYSAVIAHLAEGRRQDPYNMREIELVEMLGLDLPQMNFVHGVGVTPDHMKRMGSKNMGLIWSPFSNLLLYAQTLDILSAHQAGVRIALGSDWLPTGSKGVLEEVKLAAQYVDKDASLKAVFNDEYLFKMMTENPARMINHWEIKTDSTGKVIEAGVGQIALGAMGSVIVTSLKDANPYSNLVRKINEENVNLVVIDGNVIYGNEDYVKQAGIASYEYLSKEPMGVEKIINRGSIPTPPAENTKETAMQHLIQLGSIASSLNAPNAGTCQFKTEKVFVNQSTVLSIPVLANFMAGTKLNLDRFFDIQKLLSLNALSQSKNLTDSKEGDVRYALTYFPPLYSCNDANHSQRIQGMVRSQGNDEWTDNVSARSALRIKQKLGKLPESLNKAYQ